MKASEFILSGAERARLAELAAAEGRAADRAKIVLACSEPGVVYARLADELWVSVMTSTMSGIGSLRRGWPGWSTGPGRAGRKRV